MERAEGVWMLSVVLGLVGLAVVMAAVVAAVAIINDAVMEYNTAQQQFPAVLVAASLGFHPAAPFALDDPAERAVPTVSF